MTYPNYGKDSLGRGEAKAFGLRLTAQDEVRTKARLAGAEKGERGVSLMVGP